PVRQIGVPRYPGRRRDRHGRRRVEVRRVVPVAAMGGPGRGAAFPDPLAAPPPLDARRPLTRARSPGALTLERRSALANVPRPGLRPGLLLDFAKAHHLSRDARSTSRPKHRPTRLAWRRGMALPKTGPSEAWMPTTRLHGRTRAVSRLGQGHSAAPRSQAGGSILLRAQGALLQVGGVGGAAVGEGDRHAVRAEHRRELPLAQLEVFEAAFQAGVVLDARLVASRPGGG